MIEIRTFFWSQLKCGSNRTLGWETGTHLLLWDCCPISLLDDLPSVSPSAFSTFNLNRKALSSLYPGLDLSWSLWSASLLITNDPLALSIILKMLDQNSSKNSYSANYIFSAFLGSPYSLSWSWIWIISSGFKLFADGFWKATNSSHKWIQLIMIQKSHGLPFSLSLSLFFVFLSPLPHSGLEYHKSLNSLGEEFHDSVFCRVDSILLTWSSTWCLYYISTLDSIFTTSY